MLAYNARMSTTHSNSTSLPVYAWALPILALAAIAYFTPMLDIAISSHFFDREQGYFPSAPIYELIRQWGVIPAMIVAVVASLFFALTYVIKRWSRWRPYALLLILPMALGAGVITHGIFKDHWGRPRPRQVENFGGENPYRPFYKPDWSWEIRQLKSFPCGHCTMGFYFFAVALLFRRLGYKWLYVISLLFALALGTALGIARIAQGGHFFSDVLAAALVMWLTAAACDWLIFIREEEA